MSDTNKSDPFKEGDQVGGMAEERFVGEGVKPLALMTLEHGYHCCHFYTWQRPKPHNSQVLDENPGPFASKLSPFETLSPLSKALKFGWD